MGKPLDCLWGSGKVYGEAETYYQHRPLFRKRAIFAPKVIVYGVKGNYFLYKLLPF